MQFNAREKALMKALSKFIHAAINESKHSQPDKRKGRFVGVASAAKKASDKPTTGKRLRRSAADVKILHRQVIADRKKNIPVAEIARKNKITTAYIYQLVGRS